MALGLSGNDHPIERHQLADELLIFPVNYVPIRPLQNFRLEDRIVFGERIIPLDLKIGLAMAGNAMEENRLFHGGYQSVANAANGISQRGRRSRKKPRLTTTGFLRARRSVGPAANSWGRYQLDWPMMANNAIGSGFVVILLRKRGKIVAYEMKLRPNQKKAPSRKLTLKFQR